MSENSHARRGRKAIPDNVKVTIADLHALRHRVLRVKTMGYRHAKVHANVMLAILDELETKDAAS